MSLVLTRNAKKASILSLGFLLVFFTLGRALNFLEGRGVDASGWPFGLTKTLMLLSGLFLFLVWLWIRKVSTKSLAKINSTLLMISTALVASTFVSIVPPYLTGTNKTPLSEGATQTNAVSKIQKSDLPDIYYLLFDGYARADILKENFNLDNTGFLDSLKERGFYVAEKSNSNYTHTHFSMPSTFNMKYLNYLTEEMGEESTDRKPLRELLENNEVVALFKSFGYKYVQFGAQWGWAENSPQEDIEVEAKNNSDSKILNIKLDEFALVYMQTTALKPWISTDLRNNLVAKVLGAFEKAEAVSNLDEPTLTYAHIVSPHPPYLFDKQGIVKRQTELELLNDGFSNRQGFADQTVHINKLILDLVDKILKNSDKPPIIIIASDHGPASSLNRSDFLITDPDKFNKEGIKERLANLNTFYFPDKNYSKLYPSITPVNTFRVILNQYFGQDLKLLPDRSYFSNNKANEYRMFDVTELVN